MDFMERQVKADKPFFCWWNSTKMHINTHLEPSVVGKTGLGVTADGMVEHDRQVGQLLAKLEELGIADNTIVIYSTDNGAEELSWPDGGTTPFRGEKDTNWEGGWRVPTAIRWPGVIKPGTVSNEVHSHQDMLPTLVAAAGEPDIVAKCKTGYTAGKKTFKVHLDGYDLGPHFRGEAPNPRPGFMYWGDEGDLMALRLGDWKIHFAVQRAEGVAAWQEPLVELRYPMLVNLRTDPFENAEISGTMYYNKWRVDHTFALAPFGAVVGQYMATMAEFPPRNTPESWSPAAFLAKLRAKKEALENGTGVGVK
jgi:arylsulfatase